MRPLCRCDGREVVSCELIATTLEAEIARLGSQRELARRLREIVTYRQLSRIIAKEHCPSLERAVAISAAIGKDVFDVFTIKLTTRPVVPQTRKKSGRPKKRKKSGRSRVH